MRKLTKLAITACLLVLARAVNAQAQQQPVAAAGDGPSISLTEAQIPKLKQLLATEPQAAACYAPLRQTADEALQATPNPIALMQTEGKLQSDPVKKRTWESIGDMPKMSALAQVYAVSGDAKYAAKVRQFVLAWAKVNHSAGDPIDDTNYEGMLVAYDLTRLTFPADQRQVVDDYLRGIADVEIHTGSLKKQTSVNNWNSHRLKTVGLIAFILHDPARIAHVVSAYKKQVEVNLLPDGSSIDFHERDALHYQEYDTTPLLTLAIAARNNGIDLYHYQAPSGSSLPKSVDFLVPFCDGSQTHAEFVNSTVEFDRKRAAEGQAEYKAGHLWNPHAGLPTLERAELWQPSLLPLVAKLAKPDAPRYPTWQIVLNDAMR